LPVEKNAEFWGDISTRIARVRLFKCGAKIDFLSLRDGRAGDEAERGDVKDQSPKSRRRAAFDFDNAACSWAYMSVLTWHYAPSGTDVKTALRKLRREWSRRWGESMDAWMMEMQVRGVPHFHIFVAAESRFGQHCASMPTRSVTRREHETTIVGGSAEWWLVDTWLRVSGQRDDVDARAFHYGGIIEKMRSPDAAGRYVAKECSKRAQKILPPEYAEGLGRWWWLNPLWKPVELASSWVSLDEWPWEAPMAHVWDRAQIEHLGAIAMNKATMRELFFRECEDRGYTG